MPKTSSGAGAGCPCDNSKEARRFNGLLKWPTYIVPRQLNDAAVAHFLTPRPCNSLSALREKWAKRVVSSTKNRDDNSSRVCGTVLYTI